MVEEASSCFLPEWTREIPFFISCSLPPSHFKINALTMNGFYKNVKYLPHSKHSVLDVYITHLPLTSIASLVQAANQLRYSPSYVFPDKRCLPAFNRVKRSLNLLKYVGNLKQRKKKCCPFIHQHWLRRRRRRSRKWTQRSLLRTWQR